MLALAQFLENFILSCRHVPMSLNAMICFSMVKATFDKPTCREYKWGLMLGHPWTPLWVFSEYYHIRHSVYGFNIPHILGFVRIPLCEPKTLLI